MHVRQVLGSGARRETYTLVDDDGRVIELVDDYLALCTDREHSPNTLRARAYDLKEWLTFLRLLDIAPLAAVPEHVDQFAGWLRRPVGPGQLRPEQRLLVIWVPRSPRRGHGRPAGTSPAGTSRRSRRLPGRYRRTIGWGTADPAEREETPAGDAVRCRGPADLGRLRPVAGSPPDVGDVRDRLPDRPGPGHASRGHQHRPAHHHAAATGEQRQPGSRE